MKFRYLIFTGLLAFALSACGPKFESGPYGPVDFQKVLEQHPETMVLDVRTFDEFYSGHLTDAYSMDYYEPNFKARLDTLNRNRPIGVYCLVGQRSAEAYELLAEMGFKKIIHLTGGTVAWRRENLPLEGGPGRYKPVKGQGSDKQN